MKGPARLDAHVDVHAAGAAGLGPALETHLFEQGLHFESDASHVGPGDAGAGIEIDAQLVGMIEIGGADGVGMKFDAAEVDDPGQSGGIVDDDLFGGSAGGKRKRDGAQPGGAVGRRALLVERFAFGAVHEAFENDGAIANSGESAGRDGKIVADEVELR